MERRHFIRSGLLGAAALGSGAAGLSRVVGQEGAAAAPAASGRPLALGFDNFSIRAWNWKAPRLLAFAAERKCDGVLFSDLDVYESLEESALRDLRKRADDLGLFIHAGTGGICPTSAAFNDKWGNADEHLALTIRVAAAVGSPVARCYLGNGRDRSSEGGIRARIADTVKVLANARTRAADAGVTIAVENHAGDLQAHELRDLIEEAGPDFVGATIDAGNAAWTLEDPVANLEMLAPYAATTGIRDTMVWNVEEGTRAQWTAIGDGNVDMERYFETFARLCPDVPVMLEIISEFGKTMPWRDPAFWNEFPEARAADFARFLTLAESGRETPGFEPGSGDREEALRAFQMDHLTRSLEVCRHRFGIGRRDRA